jgi:hypothetical protein
LIAGIKELCDDWHGFFLVDSTDEDKVTVPLKWMPLMADEKVIAGVGQSYIISSLEIFLSICTFGCYFLFVLRRKMLMRSALILTTKRIVEIVIFQRKGRFPVSFGNVDVTVRSLFPGEIKSGFIRGFGERIIAGIQTGRGTLLTSLPGKNLLFAQRMQMVTSKQHSLPLSYNDIKSMLPEKVNKVHQRRRK